MPLARGVRSELRMAWLIKNCFFLVGDTRLAGELGREVHLRSSIRLGTQTTKFNLVTLVKEIIKGELKGPQILFLSFMLKQCSYLSVI